MQVARESWVKVMMGELDKGCCGDRAYIELWF